MALADHHTNDSSMSLAGVTTAIACPHNMPSRGVKKACRVACSVTPSCSRASSASPMLQKKKDGNRSNISDPRERLPSGQRVSLTSISTPQINKPDDTHGKSPGRKEENKKTHFHASLCAAARATKTCMSHDKKRKEVKRGFDPKLLPTSQQTDRITTSTTLFSQIVDRETMSNRAARRSIEKLRTCIKPRMLRVVLNVC
jgi:hypothetical protein